MKLLNRPKGCKEQLLFTTFLQKSQEYHLGLIKKSLSENKEKVALLLFLQRKPEQGAGQIHPDDVGFGDALQPSDAIGSSLRPDRRIGRKPFGAKRVPFGDDPRKQALVIRHGVRQDLDFGKHVGFLALLPRKKQVNRHQASLAGDSPVQANDHFSPTARQVSNTQAPNGIRLRKHSVQLTGPQDDLRRCLSCDYC